MVYLDYAATAKPTIHVSDYTSNNWMNVNSYYSTQEKNKFKECEEKVKKTIGAKSGKIIFGSNASWFFKKLYNIQKNYWLCGPYEHSCVYDEGLVVENIDKVSQLRNETCCYQYVNNITGQIFPVEKLGQMVKSKGGFFVCDMTAAIGRCKVPDVIENWCDAIIFSSHKIGVDNKQIGCAWISDKFYGYLTLEGTVVNGYGLVDGTPDLACAMATTDAIILACSNVGTYNQRCNELNYYLNKALLDKGVNYSGVSIDKATAAIGVIILPNINADVLCRYLAEKEIYVGLGHSACEENNDYRVLKKYGLTQEECESTIRVSFGPDTTKEDIDILVNGIVEFKERFCND